MSSPIRLIALALSSLLLVSTGFGQPVKIAGEVKGANSKPAKGADVRVDRVDKKAAPVMAKTDAKGQFAATVLDVGTYKVTAMLPGGIQSSQIVKADGKKQLLINFDLKPTSAKTVAAVTKKRSIWIPSPTGTHMLGHWEEIDDNSPTHTRTVQGQPIEYMSGRDLEGYTRTQAAPNGIASGSGALGGR
ncbi:MAG TPA: carboxypeptidase-like regulatory domain-containing protein [Chthoniobacterales bacterium]|jgi:Tfp pilus assembly ATPase PilU|nr:carboxypeptidase-like regulatory domain-containing protein [Chthoniobacterales bacterium]